MNVLMIGGTGILSTDICALAIKKGCNVFILNRGKRTYALNKDATLIKCDIRKESIEQIREKIRENHYDTVIDFLAFCPLQVEKTLKCIKGLCDQYIFISSATAYIKSSEDEIITENTPIGNPKWDYAYQKSLSEEYLKKNYKTYVNHWSVVRPYVTYNETRIPYAIVADGCYWGLINRVNIGKPIVLWDGGKSKCTITNSKDFAVGVVGIFCNEKAYEEAFHVTGDEQLTWKEVLDDTLLVNGRNAEIIDMPVSEIIRILPEFKGILCGDKGTNMVFDNAKIKMAVPEFETTVSFADGIKGTLQYFDAHPELKILNFIFEGRLDYLVSKYYKKHKIKYNNDKLTIRPYIRNNQVNRKKDKLKYFIGRHSIVFNLFNIITKKMFVKKGMEFVKRVLGK